MARYLREQGLEAYALRGGLNGWVQAGYPTEPKSVEAKDVAPDVCPVCGRAMGAHAGP